MHRVGRQLLPSPCLLSNYPLVLLRLLGDTLLDEDGKLEANDVFVVLVRDGDRRCLPNQLRRI